MNIFCGDPEIFDQPGARRSLVRMFLRVAEGQHTLIAADVERLLASSFFRSIAPEDRVEWEELVRRTLSRFEQEHRDEEPGARPTGIHASVGSSRGARGAGCLFALAVEEIGEWAERPLRLLMENERDWSLLEAAARVFEVLSVEDAYLKGWLIVDGRGGCGEVLNSLRRRREMDRLFAFVDQDPDTKTGARSSTVKAIEDTCREEPVVPYHVTHKREIENYVPGTILELHALKERKPSAKRAKRPRPGSKHAGLVLWKQLSPLEKDLDDLKKRFGKDLMEKAIRDLRDPNVCLANDFIERAGAELGEVLRSIEAHL